MNSLINSNLGWNFRPKTSIFDRCDWLLWVTVHMHMQHQAAERRSQVIGKFLIRHAAQDQIHIQLTRDFVDCQVLTVQTHPCKEVQLTSVKMEGFSFKNCFDYCMLMILESKTFHL